MNVLCKENPPHNTCIPMIPLKVVFNDSRKAKLFTKCDFIFPLLSDAANSVQKLDISLMKYY